MTSRNVSRGPVVPLVFFLSLLLRQACDVAAGRRFCALVEKENLKLWSEGSTWGGNPPGRNGKVIIESGRNVVLDEQPPVLSSLTIEKGAALIWGDVANITLQTDYILVEGELHIGSLGCPMEKPAFIKLTGLSNSKNFVSDVHEAEIRKVILVRGGATLELHGMRKTPWTRLAQTVYPVDRYPCAFVYDHADYKANPFAKETAASKALHVIAWNRDGSVLDYNPFLAFGQLKTFVENLPDGVVIGMFTSSIPPFGAKDRAILLDVIRGTLGGLHIDEVRKNDLYSLLTIKGQSNVTLEHHGNNIVEETYLALPIWDTGRDFQVAKSAKTIFQYFRVLTTDASYPILELADNVINWLPGDKLVVASTDYDWNQAEVVEIAECGSECGRIKARNRIRVKGSFRYMHFGNFTYNVDQRAEVGLLSRNILIEGVMEDECYPKVKAGKKRCDRVDKDTFGGHIRILKGHAAAHVEGVELYHMGQLGVRGAYPLHFHLCDNANGSWVRDNSIHHSFQRCVTIHGTDGVVVSGIVCYDHLGHGFFLEDGVEENNVFDRNLGLSTQNGLLLLSDMKKQWCEKDFKNKDTIAGCGDTATFWISHPNNVFTNNAAAGGVKHGYAFIFTEMPLGLSFGRQRELKKVMNYTSRYTPVKKFYNNVAHSYYVNGVFFDSHISTGRLGPWEKYIPENGVVQEENYYEPRSPVGTVAGKIVWETKLERFTGYKNKRNNMWVKGGNINVTFCSLADGSMQSISGGTTGKWTGVSIEYCIFIGRSDNKGEPRKWVETFNKVKLTHQFDHSFATSPWGTIRGVGIYQGPMFVKHSYFDRFTTEYWNDSWTDVLGKRPFSPGAAISFKRDSTYPTYTSQYTTNLTFGFCDNENDSHWVFWGNSSLHGWHDEDGTKASHNLDRDGSLTGTPNTYIVRNRSFFTGPECTYRPDWDMSMCPYRYVKVEFLGEGGSMTPANRGNWALVAYRDDARHDPYYHEGRQRREYLVRSNSSILMGYNMNHTWAAWPSEVKVLAHGVERQDVVRVGICMPKTMTKFDIRSEYPTYIMNTNYTVADSLHQLDTGEDKSAIFHDKKNGILFLNVWSRYDRTNDSQLCTGGYCYKVRILIRNGLSEKMRSCFSETYPPPLERDRKYIPKKVPLRKKCFGQGSPVGLGAVRWNEVPKIVHKEKELPCVTLKPPAEREPPTCLGCFLPEGQTFQVEQKLGKTMTIEWCTHRCYGRGFEYAGLIKASVCSCGHQIDPLSRITEPGDRLCDSGCPGNKTQKCGVGNRMAIWSTGRPLTEDPPSDPIGC